MTPALRDAAEAAMRAIDAATAEDGHVTHAEIRAAASAVIEVRDRAVEGFRAGALPRETLDRANSLTSLAYGAEFPLSGLHLDRLRRTRNGLADLIG